ncbi:MAG: hypothetical protein ACJ77Z_06615 [Thermoleophilaceae bacterium]
MPVVDEEVRKWRDWIEGPIRNDILGMHHERQLWRELGELITANPAVAETPSAFWDLMRETYGITQAIAIRRQADRDSRVCSLARLIEEMRDDAPRLTRDYFVGLWDKNDDYWTRVAHSAFDALAGPGGVHLDPEVPKTDLERLRSDASKMATYVNEHVAHDMAEPTVEDFPTFDDMNAAMDALGEMFKKYASVLTASSYVFLEPAMQYDWKAIFRRPWIPSE